MTPADRDNYLDHIFKRDSERIRASTEGSVAEILSVVAAMIGCPVPATVVISKYIQILSKYPHDLLELSAEHVLKNHKWNNFPKVAEFVEPIQEIFTNRQIDFRETKKIIKTYKQGAIRHVGSRPPAGGKGPQPIATTLPKITQQKGD